MLWLVRSASNCAFQYNAASQLTDLRRYASATADVAALKIHSRQTYDAAGRVTSITHGKTEIAAGQNWSGTSTVPSSLGATGMLAGYSVSYDTVGRVSNLGSWRDAFSTSYTYNATNQLTAATSAVIAGITLPNPLPTAESYNLDANGNRRTAAGVSQSATGTHNRLQSDGTYSYTYDNEGNVLRRTKIVGGQVTDYAWDHRNRLVSVTEKVSATGAITKKTEYIYDAFDQRVGKRLDIGTIGTWDRYEAFIWADGQEVMRLVDSDGQVATQPYRIANRYLWGASVDQLLADEQYSLGAGPAVNAATASTTAGNTLWALNDQLGSVRDLVDNNGVIRQHVVYDSFGKRLREVDYNSAGAVIASTDPAAVDELFGYTGRDWDIDTQLQNNRARWYDPATGRWLSQDPIGFAAGDANLYRYVGNGVTGATDPSGLVMFKSPVHRTITQSAMQIRGIDPTTRNAKRLIEFVVDTDYDISDNEAIDSYSIYTPKEELSGTILVYPE
ncbi:MAG: RHS repeat-associated core domain-containing protein [Pirellulales bacterium]